MDAVKFLKEWGRMCDSFEGCQGCGLSDIFGTTEGTCWVAAHPKEAVDMVEAIEKWSNEHPIKTNAQKFEELFDCKCDRRTCPPILIDCLKIECTECLKWWDKEYIEPYKETEPCEK